MTGWHLWLASAWNQWFVWGLVMAVVLAVDAVVMLKPREPRRHRPSATAMPTRDEVERVVRNAEKAGVPARRVERPR